MQDIYQEVDDLDNCSATVSVIDDLTIVGPSKHVCKAYKHFKKLMKNSEYIDNKVGDSRIKRSKTHMLVHQSSSISRVKRLAKNANMNKKYVVRGATKLLGGAIGWDDKKARKNN